MLTILNLSDFPFLRGFNLLSKKGGVFVIALFPAWFIVILSLPNRRGWQIPYANRYRYLGGKKQDAHTDLYLWLGICKL
jgi:hypothetical protein